MNTRNMTKEELDKHVQKLNRKSEYFGMLFAYKTEGEMINALQALSAGINKKELDEHHVTIECAIASGTPEPMRMIGIDKDSIDVAIIPVQEYEWPYMIAEICDNSEDDEWFNNTVSERKIELGKFEWGVGDIRIREFYQVGAPIKFDPLAIYGLGIENVIVPHFGEEL